MIRKVLWLASWYPNPAEPVLGDFIQRHAKAVSLFVRADVIHVMQGGKDTSCQNIMIESANGQLTETVCNFSFQKCGIAFADKIRYNLKYLKFYTHVLKRYEQQHGKPDLIHVHVPMKAGLLAMKFAKRWNVPYIVSEQSSMYDYSDAGSFSRRSYFFRTNTAKIFRNAGVVTNVSGTIGKIIQELFQLKKIEAVHNVADTSFFFYKPKRINKNFRWLHVSSLYMQKNIPGMLRAFAMLKEIKTDWELVIVGPVTESLRQLAVSLQLQDHIQFTGEIAYHKVAEEMQQADAFLLFSNHENFPCVIAEALCCGLPVVSSDAGGVKEAVNESNGMLVAREDEQGLMNAVIAISSNYNLYNRKKISEVAMQKFSYETIGRKIISIYQQALQGFNK